MRDLTAVEKQTMSANYAALAYQTMPSHLVQDNDQTGLLL